MFKMREWHHKVIQWILVYVYIHATVWNHYTCSAANGEKQDLEKIRIGVVHWYNTETLELINRTWNTVFMTHPYYSLRYTARFISLVFTKPTQQTSLKDILKAQSYISSLNLTFIIGDYVPHILIIANDLRIPYLITYTQGYDWKNQHTSSCGFPMVFNPYMVHNAIRDLVCVSKWKEVGVVYDSDEGLNMVEKFLLKESINVHTCRINTSQKKTSTKSCLQQMRNQSVKKILLVCRKKIARFILKRALQLSMLTHQYTWVLADTESTDIDLSDYSESGVAMYSFKPANNSLARPHHLNQNILQDSLQLMEVTMTTHKAALQRRRFSSGNSDYCASVKKVKIDGVTGHVSFLPVGHRKSDSLDVILYRGEGWQEIGNWTMNNKIGPRIVLANEVNSSVLALTKRFQSLSGRTLKVVTIEETPFLRKKKDYKKRWGNDRFEGFLMDMLKIMEKNLNFKSEIYEVKDNSYGSKHNGEWNGMVREIIDDRADLILSALAITSQRENVIDFTKPFGEMRLSILMKKPEVKSSIFQFLWPISTTVWLTVLAVWLASSVVLYLVDKFSPNSDIPGEEMFSLNNSVWFMYTSLVGSGSDSVPRTWSARIIAGVWWFVSLILISSYTANLAAFLTITKIESPIRSLADLGAQDRIQYGSVKKSYPASFFERSKSDLLQKMWHYMSEVHPEVLVDSVEEGIKKVKQGNYAFIWDHNGNEYVRDSDCDTMIVGEPFSWRVYGIGVPIDAYYREELSIEILKMQEHGHLNELKVRWWHKSKCEDIGDKAPTRTQELTLQNLAGVFVVLTIGCVLALAVCFIEYIVNRSKLKKKTLENGKGRDYSDHSCSPIKGKNSIVSI